MALERSELPLMLAKRCHNQANNGLRKKERKKEREKERNIMQSLSNVVTTRLAKA